jgi:hypothetical protein
MPEQVAVTDAANEGECRDIPQSLHQHAIWNGRARERATWVLANGHPPG